MNLNRAGYVMESLWMLALLTIAVVLVFDFTNGFHDAANVVATVIASRAMTPAAAVLIVGVFEFLGPLLGGTAVANTLGSFLELSALPPLLAIGIVLSGLIGAIFWNLLTWWWGIPSSSSHALVGGLIGATLMAATPGEIVWGFAQWGETGRPQGVAKVILALILSPLLGFGVGFLMHKLFSFLLRGAKPSINRHLRGAQYVTTAGLAFSHGANDAQKSMGILTLVLVLGGFIPHFDVPFWVVLACATTLTLGVLSGGWRIVRTLGFAVYKVRPVHALESQLTSASVILAASMGGAPVSTSHVVASSIMGVGSGEHIRQVRWGKASEILTTWVVTLPAAALAGALACLCLTPFLR
jgi:inorganic phosphate transporter, PiT family